MIQRKFNMKNIFKGVILLELAGVVGVYLLYHKIDSSQDFRHTMNRRLPSVLEVYYKSNEWAGIQGLREKDALAWNTKKN
ncbi:protein CEBPZOS isoform X3 [Pseudophryne corroboree]|uniref:protein CEBPZOS isoform X3 n=1 Tax=Pseudophryne corroboree TaxID=495146 RepID=UPI003081A6CD